MSWDVLRPYSTPTKSFYSWLPPMNKITAPPPPRPSHSIAASARPPYAVAPSAFRATARQVRRRSLEPHGPDLSLSAGHGRPVRQAAGAWVELNGAFTPAGRVLNSLNRVLRHPARGPGGLRQPDRCEQRATASLAKGAQSAPKTDVRYRGAELAVAVTTFD